MRRIISALLCMCLIMTSVCVTVFADETTSGVIETITGTHGNWGGTVVDDTEKNTRTITGDGSKEKHIRYVPTGLINKIGESPVQIEIEFTLDKYASSHTAGVYFQMKDGKYNFNQTKAFETTLQQGNTYTLNIAITKELKLSASLNGVEKMTGTLTTDTTKETAASFVVGFYQPTDSEVKDKVTFKQPKAYIYSDDYTYAYNGKLANAPQKLSGTYVATTDWRNGNVLMNGSSDASSSYPIELSYKIADVGQQPSFRFKSSNTNGQYSTDTSGTEDIKWLRLSVNIDVKKDLGTVNIGSAADESHLSRRSVGTLNNGGNYQIDVIHNLETGEAVTYNNYVKVTENTLPMNTTNNNYYMITAGNLSFNKNEAFAVINSAKFMEYTASQTLEDFQAEMDDSAKKGSRTITLVPSKRGGSSVAANSDGGYDITSTNSGQTSQYIDFGENIPFYTEETKESVNIPFVRLHTEIRYDNYNGGYFQFMPIYQPVSTEEKGTRAGTIAAGDNKTHSFDILLDMMAKQMYIYLDGVLAENRDTGNDLTSGMINKLVLFESSQQAADGKFNIKNTKLTLYYDREPVVSTIDELCNLVKSDDTVALSGAFRYYNATQNKYALVTGYAGFDKNAHLGIVAEYDENNNLIRALSLTSNNQYLTEDGSAKTIRVFIWDKTTLEPLADSVSAYIPE